VRIIHKNDVVLATIDGENVKAVLDALGMTSNQVSTISLDANQSRSLEGRAWSVQNGKLVIGDVLNFAQPVPVLEEPSTPSGDFQIETRRLITQLQAALEAVQTELAALKSQA